MTDSIDIGVAVRQGIYYRPDAKRYMNDRQYRAWQRHYRLWWGVKKWFNHLLDRLLGFRPKEVNKWHI